MLEIIQLDVRKVHFLLYNVIMVIVILIVLAAVFIFVNRQRSKKSNIVSPEAYQASQNLNELNDEILAELNKPNPDYERLKMLRAEMEKLKVAQQQTYQQQHSVNNEDISSGNIQQPNNGVSGSTIALYVGSLLILAGVSGLVFSGAKTSGLILLILMTAVFYVGGILMRKSETLKSVSYVFVGTGMMILPFLGLLIYDIIGSGAELIWLIMSLISIPMYLFATYIMQSKVFSYFSIVGIVSLSCSLASVIGLALVWYFVFVMIIGLAFKVLSMVSGNAKLGIMQKSIEQAGEWLPLATIITSLMAAWNLTELDYVIILGILLLHVAIGYIFKPNVMRESLLRLVLPAWIILFSHFVVPEFRTVGIVLALVALVQTVVVFINVFKGLDREPYRRGTEDLWLIASLVSFVVAGIYIGSGDVTVIWSLVSLALVVNTMILFAAKYTFKRASWGLGLLLAGIALPLTIMNALKVDMEYTRIVCAISYLFEMVGMVALYWKDSKTDGDALTILSVSILGFAALIPNLGHYLASVVFAITAICFLVQGFGNKRDGLKEAAVYCIAAGVYSLIDSIDGDFGLEMGPLIKLVILGHIALLGFIVSDVLWSKKSLSHIRLAIGCIMLLFAVGGSAIGGASWAMYMFLVETVAVLVCGVIMKDSALRIIGAIGAFLAVLWFTKDLSFVWPIILGLGIIGVVVFVLVKNGRGSLPEQPKPKW